MRVSCAQYAVRDGGRDPNLERSLHFIRRAAAEGADLVVLPELANSGCDLGTRDQALDLAEEIPSGPTVRAWSEEAEEFGVCVVGGLLEKEGDTLYNSAFLVGPGVLGRYRKTHLWDKEKLRYEPGRELPVFDTPLGRIGVLICYDIWFPEAARTLALKGAQILCAPSNAPTTGSPNTSAGATSRCSTSTASPPPTPTASSSPPPTASGTATWDAAASWTLPAASWRSRGRRERH